MLVGDGAAGFFSREETLSNNLSSRSSGYAIIMSYRNTAAITTNGDRMAAITPCLIYRQKDPEFPLESRVPRPAITAAASATGRLQTTRFDANSQAFAHDHATALTK